jgi:large-conductance mechanosensitive channel
MSTIDRFDIDFNFARFIKFLDKYNILGVAIAAVLSDRINELTSEFVNLIIMPIINRDGDGDGVHDSKKLEDKTMTVFGIQFRIGKFVMSVIKFVVITYIIFIASIVINKVSNMQKVNGWTSYPHP